MLCPSTKLLIGFDSTVLCMGGPLGAEFNRRPEAGNIVSFITRLLWRMPCGDPVATLVFCQRVLPAEPGRPRRL
jgi:hypothetical protein